MTQTQQTGLELGQRPSKRASTDQLLAIMRQIKAEHPDISRSEAMKLYRQRVRDDADLVDANIDYTGEALWDRCTPHSRYEPPSDDDRQAAERIKEAAKEIIMVKVVLWTWKLPTNGKPLCDCTFGEIAEAAPFLGRFLSRLAMQGAPGSLVREVFADKQALQDFWAQHQK